MAPSPIATDDEALIAALRGGDERAFATLVDRHSPAMMRAAMAYVPSRAAAEEAVQETWIAVMRGIDGFEGRSALKTWIFRILANVAMRSGARERRSTPFSALAAAEDADEPSVDPDRFLPADHKLFPGHWAIMPTAWPTPEEGLLSGETREVIVAAIAGLPKTQRTVIALRDIEGWSSEEVCEALEISAGNQRILLHRAQPRPKRDRGLLRCGRGDRLRRRNGGADGRHCWSEGFLVMADESPDLRQDDLACTEEVEMITDYLEGALPAAKASRLERHLETCPGCTEYLEQMREVAGSLVDLTEDSIPAEMREDLLGAFRDSRTP